MHLPIDALARPIRRSPIAPITRFRHNAKPHWLIGTRRSVMDKSASRRRFLQDMTALGAATGVSAAVGTTRARAQQSIAQAQPPSPAMRDAANTRNLPRIQLMIGPGTLPSVGKDRMDLL